MFELGQDAGNCNEKEETPDGETLEGEEQKDDHHGHHDAHLEHDGNDGHHEAAASEPERAGF